MDFYNCNTPIYKNSGVLLYDYFIATPLPDIYLEKYEFKGYDIVKMMYIPLGQRMPLLRFRVLAKWKQADIVFASWAARQAPVGSS